MKVNFVIQDSVSRGNTWQQTFHDIIDYINC
jgi:hypothetical protein